MKRLILLAVAALLVTAGVYAYMYYKIPRAAFYNVGSNETAFLVPEVGDNKASQAVFDSADYLRDHTVADKRIVIPYVKLANSAPWYLFDARVPTDRLYVVTRKPVAISWMDTEHQGADAEEFHFESKEGTHLHCGVVASGYVKEQDAATYMSYFGPEGGNGTVVDIRDAPAVIHAKNLAAVLNDTVRLQVQALLADQFGSRLTLDGVAHQSEAFAAIAAEVKDHFAKMGVTIQTLGLANPVTPDDDKVMEAINQVFAANRIAEAATAMQPALPQMMQSAQNNLVAAIAEASKKWSGKVPAVKVTDLDSSAKAKDAGSIFSLFNWF